jgi:hypothetical protein
VNYATFTCVTESVNATIYRVEWNYGNQGYSANFSGDKNYIEFSFAPTIDLNTFLAIKEKFDNGVYFQALTNITESTGTSSRSYNVQVKLSTSCPEPWWNPISNNPAVIGWSTIALIASVCAFALIAILVIVSVFCIIKHKKLNNSVSIKDVYVAVP